MTRRRHRRPAGPPIASAALAVLLIAGVARAAYSGGGASAAADAQPPEISQSSGAVAFPPTIVQLQYGGGGDWYANPSALPNLLAFIRAETRVPVADRPVQLQLRDPTLRDHPYLYITGHGNIRLDEDEVAILRRYLLAGGFLHVDDNYGLDESFRREIARVFPEKSLVELPHDHPVYGSVFDFPDGLPKIHLHDGQPARGFGIFHEGRLLVYYSYETDLGDGWEDAEVHGNPPELREAALRMGANLFVHALSQRAP